MTSVIDRVDKVKVSSTLQRNVKEFGKQNLIDGNPETCWNSDEGDTQFIRLTFKEPVSATELHLTFQGGFVGEVCMVHGYTDQRFNEEACKNTIYPTDTNDSQKFALNGFSGHKIQSILLEFLQFTDFYGRVTVYGIDLLG
eukprot:Clim_evm68s157 gene=Clim_evmTU68s157